MESLWTDYSDGLDFPALEKSVEVDVAIVGGGITGILTAYLLKLAGKKVAVLEAMKIGEGTTAFSTGNLYSVIDKRLHHIQSKFDQKTTNAVIESRTLAVDLIESLVAEHNIDCNFKRMPWYLYSETKADSEPVVKEKKAAMDAGLSVESLSEIPLPFKVESAIKIDGQAQFNPAAFVKALAGVARTKGCLIFAHTPVIEIQKESPLVLLTAESHVIAKNVILATHTPKGIYPVQTSLGPYREYAIAGKLRSGDYPQGIFWSTEPQHHISVRSYKKDNEDYILIIGEDHKVGQSNDHKEYYRRLETFARSKFDIENITHRWSAQHYKPADGLPYIGESMNSGIYVATGFSTDGLVWGTVSAMIFKDLLSGKENLWAHYFSAKRFTPVASAEKFIKENLNVAGEYLKDIFGKADELPILPGEGKVIEHKKDKWAVHKDETGILHVVSATCTHMGCTVNWNNAEKTWDCPCHGGRFTISGDVIEGPPLKALTKKTIS
jgi:glycine/D-amino acid oxidase-like deaminating enzyme/nitrite reductase/ring-hydroxylating ferredoxin subunit